MGMETLFDLISKDVDASRSDASTIPVSSEKDHIIVTEAISKRIGKYVLNSTSSRTQSYQHRGGTIDLPDSSGAY